jgi:hypothetical protein
MSTAAPAHLRFANRGASPSSSASDVATRRSAGRALTIAVILVSFIATTVLQHVTQVRHHELVKNTGSEAKLSNLNSFSLALLLGGLRGPLVMMLWTSSETQKQEKDLEDFNSKIELIRMLQPEFASVHSFQMWNLAYNISVQMANKPNKYGAILDALEYGYKTGESNPRDINIISQIGQLFFDKLGGSQEKDYYIDRVRRESFPDERVTVPAGRIGELESILSKAGVEPAKREVMIQQAARSGSFTAGKLTVDAIRPLLGGPGVTYALAEPAVYSDTGRRIRLSPMLDLEGNLLADMITPVNPRPADLSADAEWSDGSTLQYLKPFAPFPYGLHPMAIGWDYYKRCQVLHDRTKQKHLQLSELVIDNRPAINMRLWGESEWGMGRQCEALALGARLPTVQNSADFRAQTELLGASIPPNAPIVDVEQAKEAVYRYRLVTKTAEVADEEYVRHIRHYAGHDYGNHRDSVAAMKVLCVADADYLDAMLTASSNAERRRSLLQSAAQSYRAAMIAWEVYELKYYLSDELERAFFPKGCTKDNVQTLPPQQIDELTARIGMFLRSNKNADINSDRLEAERYFTRAYMRLVQLGAEPKGAG